MAVADLVELEMDAESARRVLREAWTKLGFSWKRASDLEGEHRFEFLTTGCKALDALLGGGISTGGITELAGEYAAGKSQTMLTVLVENLGRNEGWTAIFMDSENTFKIARLREIARARGYDPESIVSRTFVIRAPASEQFIASVEMLPKYIAENNVKLICLDSLAGPFRSEYAGREVLWLRQQMINKILRKLLQYATIFNLAVIVSNQVVSNPQAVYSGDIVEQSPPALGNIVAHGCDTRVYLRKAAGSKRIARLFDGAWLPEGQCIFQITQRGIEDVEEQS